MSRHRPLATVAGYADDGALKAEVGAVVYSQAIADAQRYFQGRVNDLDGVCYPPEFAYWKTPGGKPRG